MHSVVNKSNLVSVGNHYGNEIVFIQLCTSVAVSQMSRCTNRPGESDAKTAPNCYITCSPYSLLKSPKSD